MFKTTNFIFCRFSDANENKMVFLTLKWLFVKKSPVNNVTIIM